MKCSYWHYFEEALETLNIWMVASHLICQTISHSFLQIIILDAYITQQYGKNACSTFYFLQLFSHNCSTEKANCNVLDKPEVIGVVNYLPKPNLNSPKTYPLFIRICSRIRWSWIRVNIWLIQELKVDNLRQQREFTQWTLVIHKWP